MASEGVARGISTSSARCTRDRASGQDIERHSDCGRFELSSEAARSIQGSTSKRRDEEVAHWESLKGSNVAHASTAACATQAAQHDQCRLGDITHEDAGCSHTFLPIGSVSGEDSGAGTSATQPQLQQHRASQSKESLRPIRNVSAVEPLAGSGFHASFLVDGAFLGIIIGQQGQTVKAIESQTGASFRIGQESTVPGDRMRGRKEAHTVEVDGPSQECVGSAISTVTDIVHEAVEGRGLDYSHFVSLPLSCHAQVVSSFTQFRDSILQTSTAGVDPSIFMNPALLHITVQMLKLWSPARLAAASEALQDARPALLEALEDKPLSINVSNLHLMKGSPKKAHVLYAGVTDEDGTQTRLLRACEVLKAAMRDAGLVSSSDKDQPLKAHLTLMNTSHRKSQGKRKSFKRIPFDASTIMEANKELDWGTYTIEEAHLSQRFLFDDNGYYHCCASIQLPATKD